MSLSLEALANTLIKFLAKYGMDGFTGIIMMFVFGVGLIVLLPIANPAYHEAIAYTSYTGTIIGGIVICLCISYHEEIDAINYPYF